MPALAMEFGWRRVAAGAGGPASWLLAATLAGGATASMAQLNAVAGPSEQAETTALAARMTTAPTSGRRTLIDTAIAGLKADGVWTKLDWLVVLAAHDAQAARLNWRAAKTLAAVNSPVFTIDRGYAGDGASAYLDAGEAFDTGSSFALNSCVHGVWVNAQNSGSGNMMGVAGSTVNQLQSATTSNRSRLNAVGSALASGLSSTASRHVCATRRTANAATIYLLINGAPQISTSAASTTGAGNGLLLQANGGYAPSSHRIAAAYWGAELSDADVAVLHGRLNTYLTAIGGQ